MIEIKKASEIVKFRGIKLLIYGIAGAGKTSLVRTLPQEETLFISAESGLLSIRDLDRLDTIEIYSYDQLLEAYDLLSEETKYKWVIIDSVSDIAERVLAEELVKQKDPRQAYGNLAVDMISILKDFRDLSGPNVVFTCKQAYIKDDNGPSMFKPMLPGNQLSQQLAFLFDEVFALRIFEEKDDNGDKVVTRLFQTAPDGKYDAKDRSGVLDLYEEADLSLIEEKILANIK